MDESDIDGFDRRILALLESDSRRTGEQLSELIGLSPAACLRRIQRLRKIGAIVREVAIISPKLRRKGMRLVVLVTIDRHTPKEMDDYCNALRTHEIVESLDWVTGDDDIALLIDCESMAHFTEFADRYLNDLPVIGYKTLVSMRSYDTTG